MDPFDDDITIDPLLYGFDNYLDDARSLDEDEEPNLPPTPAPAPLIHDGVDPQLEDRKKRAPELSRDDRLMTRTLHATAGWTQATIFERRNQLLFPLSDLTIRQIQTACCLDIKLTPQKKRSGLKPKVTDEQKSALEAFIEERPENRLIPCRELPYYVQGLESVCDAAIKRALKDIKHLRTQRPRKIKYTPKHREDRVKWCLERKEWTVEQWAFYVFSDETWVNGTSPYRQWLTLHASEDPNYFATIRERPNGWMFWACFYGGTKGPFLLWEKNNKSILKNDENTSILDENGNQKKEWGYMNSTKYCEKILNKVNAFMNELDDISTDEWKFQQDNASIHASKEMVACMEKNNLWERTI